MFKNYVRAEKKKTGIFVWFLRKNLQRNKKKKINREITALRYTRKKALYNNYQKMIPILTDYFVVWSS